MEAQWQLASTTIVLIEALLWSQLTLAAVLQRLGGVWQQSLTPVVAVNLQLCQLHWHQQCLQRLWLL